MEKCCISLRSPRWSSVSSLHCVAIVSCKQVLRIKRIHNDNIQLTIIYAGLNEKIFPCYYYRLQDKLSKIEIVRRYRGIVILKINSQYATGHS